MTAHAMKGDEEGDPVMVQRTAHALKGSVGTIQAAHAQEVANELEIAAGKRDLVQAAKMFQLLSKTLILFDKTFSVFHVTCPEADILTKLFHHEFQEMPETREKERCSRAPTAGVGGC